MEIPDTPTVAQLAVRCGLVTEEQLQEAYVEVDPKGTNPQPLLGFLERKGYLTPWQSYKLLKLDPDGYYLGGYRILYKIASGSFGRVFRAEAVEHTGGDRALRHLVGRAPFVGIGHARD